MRVSEWNSKPIPTRVLERAFAHKTIDGDCWISTYSTGSHGYAQIGWQEAGVVNVVTAHRAVWEFMMGPVPVGFTLDHLCKQKRCVNPSHLRVLPNFENARRTNGRDWPLGQCVNGHPNSELQIRPNGKRLCPLCNKTWQARYNAKRRASV